MGCLGLLILLILPTRVALLLVWILSDRVELAFDNDWAPLLGLVFLPLTTLIYALVWDPAGVSFWEGSLVAFGLLGDLVGPGGLVWKIRPSQDKVKAGA